MSDITLTKGGGWLLTPVGEARILTPELFSPEQREMYNTAMKFGRDEVAPVLDEMDHADDEKKRRMNADLLKKAGEIGLLMIDIPEEYGGLGGDKTTSFLIAEAISCEGKNFSPTHGAHTGIGTLPILFFGTEEQKQKYLPKLATGEMLSAYALTEENAGSDAMNAKTRAVLSDDGKYYILNGTKQFITNSGFSDIVVVFAKIDGEAFTGFIVHRDYEGYSVGPEEKKMGLKSNSTCQVIMEDCKVPVENMLYEPGKGHKIAFNILNIGRGKLGAGVVGACKKVLRGSIKYALERKQFGKSLTEFTMIQEKLADMYLLTYAAEAMSYRTSGLWDLNIEQVPAGDFAAVSKAIEEYAIEASILKVFGSEVLDFCVDEGVQIHGGYGYIQEYEIESAYRDSRINRIFEGTNEINRMLIPGTMAKMAMKQQLPLQELVTKFTGELAEGNLPTDDGSVLGLAKMQTELMKRISVYCANAAMMKFMMGLKDEQEILRVLADMLIETYGCDTVAARVLQKIDDVGAEKSKIQIAVAKVFCADGYKIAGGKAREMIANCFEGDELKNHIANIDKLTAFHPVNTMILRREIAAEIIDREDYIS
jgi:alkylation response protein AidB-like acyl-CoA dehydrogenase